MSTNYTYVEPFPSREYSDLNYAFIQHPISNDVAKKLNEEAIKQSIKTLILISSSEKPFHPEIGAGIYELLFENMSEPGIAFAIQTKIESTLAYYEPRIEVNEIDVQALYDQNAINITIYFKVINTLEPYNLDLFIKVAR